MKNSYYKNMDFKDSLKKPSGIVVLITLIFVLGVLFWKIDGIKEMLTGLVGTEEKAILSLESSKTNCRVGEKVNLNLKLNSNNQDIVALDAFIKYNPDYFALKSIDTSNSIFGVNNECTYQGNFCQLTNFNTPTNFSTPGVVEIVQAKPSPGVNNSDGLVAQLQFRCLKKMNFSEDNFTIDLNKSNVILDSEDGENVLSGVNNLILNIIAGSSAPGKLKIKRVQGKRNKPLVFIIRILDVDTEKIIKEINKSVSDCDEQEFEVDPKVEPGSYLIKVRAAGYLAKKIAANWPPSQVIEVPILRAGDLNGDGIINELDWSLLHGHWHKPFESGDFNSDGIINTLDWSFMNRNWGLTES